MKSLRVPIALFVLVLVLASCQEPRSDCPSLVEDLVIQLEELQELTPELSVGLLDDYGSYVGQLVRVEESHAQAQASEASDQCRDDVLSPAERAFKLHARARDLWRDCAVADFCYLQPRMDRMWSSAGEFVNAWRSGLGFAIQ